ncbi:phage tail protein [Escherichia coli]|nr:phage tail protein [Escherichia coli]
MPFARYFCIFINVGLGEGSALPVGVPVPWPSATPPTGWLKCNGAAFSAEEYPELAKAYPTNKLPDLRGEFIRGWDDGRGVDSRRAVLSTQEPTVGTFYVELAIISGTLSGSGAKFTAYGGVSSNITGSYATAFVLLPLSGGIIRLCSKSTNH